jgi:hypothetical protein
MRVSDLEFRHQIWSSGSKKQFSYPHGRVYTGNLWGDEIGELCTCRCDAEQTLSNSVNACELFSAGLHSSSCKWPCQVSNAYLHPARSIRYLWRRNWRSRGVKFLNEIWASGLWRSNKSGTNCKRTERQDKLALIRTPSFSAIQDPGKKQENAIILVKA